MSEPLDLLEKREAKKNKKSFFKIFAKNFPILMVSMALHMMILLILSLFKEPKKPDPQDTIVVTQYDIPEEKIDPVVTIEKVKIEPKDIQVDIPETKETQDKEEQTQIDDPIDDTIDPVDTLNNLESLLPPAPMPDMMAFKNFDARPAAGGGLPTAYNNRSGKNKRSALNSGGGDQKTEEAVEAALKWLHHHQEKDGSWIATKYEGKEHAKSNSAITTACALLPFFGAGYTEFSGKYKRAVGNGLRYLNAAVKEEAKHPQFKSNYGASLVLMALSEATIMGSKAISKKHANIMAEFLIDQYLKNPGEGWGYTSHGNDFSVSGWVSLGLKSAKSANLPIMSTPKAKTVFKDYTKWVQTMTSETTGMGSYRPGRDGSAHMTWVGMFVRQSLGFKPTQDKFLLAAGQRTLEWIQQGRWIGQDKPGSVYGIYYGSLAAFQQEGAVWDAWNPAMKRTLVLSQKQGDPRELGGSWDPSHDHTGEIGGRIYTTALHAMSLEIYYRYGRMN